jgi:hypothetical protein
MYLYQKEYRMKKKEKADAVRLIPYQVAGDVKPHTPTLASPPPAVIKTKPLLIQRTCTYCGKKTASSDFHARFKNYHKLCYSVYRTQISTRTPSEIHTTPVQETAPSGVRRWFGILRNFFGV